MELLSSVWTFTSIKLNDFGVDNLVRADAVDEMIHRACYQKKRDHLIISNLIFFTQ